jgi:predicted secreted protein
MKPDRRKPFEEDPMGKPIFARLGLRRAPVLALALGASLLLPLGVAADEPEEGQTVLHLSQTADRAVRRDRLRAQLRVEAVGSDAKRVQAEINRLMTAALERAKSVTGIKVETSGYGVYEEQQKSAPSRWHGSQGIILVGGDFAVVLGLVGDLQGTGLAMSGLAFELAPETARAAEDELTSEALTRLRQRAERIASDLQLTLVRLRDVRVGNVGADPPRPRMMAGMAVGSAEAMPPPAAEAGDATVRVSVDAEIVLGPIDHSQP